MEMILKNKFLLILLILASICLFFTVGHYGDIFIDIGREMYYPKSIIEGKLLYRDLFCIYAPFSYLFNAFLFKIFGAKLGVLYAIGSISALFIIGLTYKISELFLNKFISFSIPLFIIVTGCLSTRIFNLTLPYSYGILYGLLFYLLSIYFLSEFIKLEKPYMIILSSIFLGLAFSNKYDFILGVFPYLIVLFKTKNLKLILKSISLLFLAFSFPFLILFLQGLKITDLLNSYLQIKAFVQTDALKAFYVTQGVYYTNRIRLDWFFKLLNFSIIIGAFYLGFILFNKKLFLKMTGGVIILFAGFLTLKLTEADYLFMTFLVSFLFILTFRKNKFIENIFLLSSILISLKSLWGLSHVNYGLYYLPLILISFFIILEKNNNKNFKFSVYALFLCLILNFCIRNALILKECNYKITTKNGTIYTIQPWGNLTNSLIEFLDKQKVQDVMIFPEGLSINFLTDKKANGYYSSLIPLYTEGLDEKTIVEYYKKNKPEYIVFSNLKMESYAKNSICVDFGMEFCNFVSKNYNFADWLLNQTGEAFMIYKLNI